MGRGTYPPPNKGYGGRGEPRGLAPLCSKPSQGVQSCEGLLATRQQFGGTNEVICHLLPFAYKRSLPYLVEPLNTALAPVCLCDFFCYRSFATSSSLADLHHHNGQPPILLQAVKLFLPPVGFSHKTAPPVISRHATAPVPGASSRGNRVYVPPPSEGSPKRRDWRVPRPIPYCPCPRRAAASPRHVRPSDFPMYHYSVAIMLHWKKFSERGNKTHTFPVMSVKSNECQTLKFRSHEHNGKKHFRCGQREKRSVRHLCNVSCGCVYEQDRKPLLR